MDKPNLLKKTASFLNQDISFKPDTRSIGMLLNQLSVMISAGISIHSALEIVSKQSINSKLKKIVDRLLIKVSSGVSFSKAVSEEDFEDTRLLSAMINAGEMSGSLDMVLAMMSDFYIKKAENNRKINSALIYPAILMVTSIIVLGFVLTYVFPIFLNLFETSDRIFPKSTQLLIGISKLLSEHGLIILFGLLILNLGIYLLYKKNDKFKSVVDTAILKLPIIGRYIKYRSVTNAAANFSILSGCGVPVLDILNIIKNSTSNTYIYKIYENIIIEITSGSTLNESFSRNKFFPELFTSMLKIGEETGNLDAVMEKTSVYYESELNNSMTALISVFEPIMILIMAIIVGFIVLSIAIPMFDLVTFVDF